MASLHGCRPTCTAGATTHRYAARLTRQWYLFVPCLVLLAIVEDALWDVLVWQDYAPRLWNQFFPCKMPELNEYWTSVATAVLSVPQITHYILDGYIWRFDQNPGLRDYLLSPPPDALAKATHAGRGSP